MSTCLLLLRGWGEAEGLKRLSESEGTPLSPLSPPRTLKERNPVNLIIEGFI